MKDLDPLHHFLDVSVEQRSDGLFLHQLQYAWYILVHTSLSNYKPYSMSVDTHTKVSSDMGSPSVT
jgi:hypothetical protein